MLILFLIAGVISVISPESTLAAIPDILGFLFLIVAAFWVVQALIWRDLNELWWIGLIAGILMIILAVWSADHPGLSDSPHRQAPVELAAGRAR